MLKEFKAFITRGNVMDMAVGIMIGAAFGKIVASFVNDVLTPPLGLLLGRSDLSRFFINLSARPVATLDQAKELGVPVIKYGLFLNTVLDFLLMALAVFLLVRLVQRLQAKPEPKPVEPTTRDCPFCLTAIPLKASRCPHCTSQLAA